MKNRKSFVLAVWWVAACLLMGVMILCFADKDERESQTENRMLQAFPTLTFESFYTGEFFSDFESYMSDAFFGRNELVSFSNSIVGLFSAQTPEDIALLNTDEQAVIDFSGEDDADNNEDDISNQVNDPGDDDSHSVTDEKYVYSYFILANGSRKQLYQLKMDKIKQVAKALDQYADELDGKGKVYYTQVPLAATANWYYEEDKYVGWGSDMEAEMAALTGDGVVVFNTIDILEPHLSAGEHCWHYLDHHWTTLGAYYVCAEMIESQGVPMVDYYDFDYKVISGEEVENGVRDSFDALYPLWPIQSKLLTRITEEKDTVFVNYNKRNYRTYLNGLTTPWRKMTTGANTGRNCLVIGDSFANAFCLYLTPYYDEVHMTDVRYNEFSFSSAGGTIAELMEYHDIDDVYIIMSDANSVNAGTQHTRLSYCLMGGEED